MKHVWILNHYAQEPGGTGATRHYSLAKYLREHGWKATIIAASTEHLSGRQRLEPDEAVRFDTFDGVPFVWLRTPKYSGNGLDRIRNMLAYSVRALKPANLSKLKPPDAVIGSSVHPFAAWAGLRLARRYRVPFIFEVRDLWPKALIDMGRLRERSVTTFLFRELEKHLYRAASKIVVLWPNAGAYIKSIGITDEKIVWISNGIDIAEWNVSPSYVDDDEFTLMYFGAHGGANGLDNVVRAMRLVQDAQNATHIRLRLIGDGPRKAQLRKLARSMGLTNVRFEDPVPKECIPALSREADAFIFNLIDAPMFEYGISPRKLYDFMAAGRPTIFCCRASNNPIEESGGGITVAPGEPEKLAKALMSLASLPKIDRERMGQAARQHVEQHYSYSVLAQQLAATLNDCACPLPNGVKTTKQLRSF